MYAGQLGLSLRALTMKNDAAYTSLSLLAIQSLRNTQFTARNGLRPSRTEFWSISRQISTVYNSGKKVDGTETSQCSTIYTALIEDDTLAVEGWYPRVLEALRDVEKKMEVRAGADWMFLRLFYFEGYFGWHVEYLPIHLFWSFISWAVVTASLAVARRSIFIKAFLSEVTILAISAVCIPALIVLFFASGRNSIWPLTPGIHEMNKLGCCSQGYIYPRDIVTTLLQRTNLEIDWYPDMMVEDMANEEGWVRWAVTPALLQHIGTTSSKGYGFENAGQLWNFQFELYDKSRLGRSNG
jgi:hypothetical protein